MEENQIPTQGQRLPNEILIQILELADLYTLWVGFRRANKALWELSEEIAYRDHLSSVILRPYLRIEPRPRWNGALEAVFRAQSQLPRKLGTFVHFSGWTPGSCIKWGCSGCVCCWLTRPSAREAPEFMFVDMQVPVTHDPYVRGLKLSDEMKAFRHVKIIQWRSIVAADVSGMQVHWRRLLDEYTRLEMTREATLRILFPDFLT